jgi:hypothetical protein
MVSMKLPLTVGYGSRKDALKGKPTDITAGPAASKRFELSQYLKAIFL